MKIGAMIACGAYGAKMGLCLFKNLITLMRTRKKICNVLVSHFENYYSLQCEHSLIYLQTDKFTVVSHLWTTINYRVDVDVDVAMEVYNC